MVWTHRLIKAGFFAVSFLALLALFSFAEVGQLRDQEKAAVGSLRNLQFDYVEGALSGFLKDSDAFGKALAQEIRVKVLSFYQAHPERSIAKDLADINQNNHPVINIIGEAFKGKYLNGVENDNNDPWAAMKDRGIIGDFSLNCSAAGRSRTFDQEVALHASPALAREAIQKIILQEPTLASSGRTDHLIFWSFLAPIKPEYLVSSASIETLRDLFLKYPSLDSLASYEFLVPQYIDQDKDLSGKPLVTERGFRNQVNQLIIVSGFNLVDQFTAVSTNTAKFQAFDEEIRLISQRFESDIFSKQMMTLALVLMFLVCCAGMYFIEGKIENEEEK